MIVYQPARLTLDGTIRGRGAVLLDPSDWPGHTLPLLLGRPASLTAEADLADGEWTLILYRPSCKVCRAELAREEAHARNLVREKRPVRTVVVELPPVSPPDEDAVDKDSPLVRGWLDERRAWFVHTPLVVRIRAGIVTGIEFPQPP